MGYVNVKTGAGLTWVNVLEYVLSGSGEVICSLISTFGRPIACCFACLCEQASLSLSCCSLRVYTFGRAVVRV